MSSDMWPMAWTGTWIAPDRKTVRLSHDGERVLVTVCPGPDQPPYDGAELPTGGTARTERLASSTHRDKEGRRYLEVEAGVVGIGPTYQLYAAVRDGTELRAAGDDAVVDQLVLVPNTMMGLYDDFEDDLGVPWAYPLHPLRWQAE
ncbi:hypothetical protein O7632_10930 [Solwaraspora sp. WMMD406]|uniref:hypothetical protein n=1 Tax=Solwaraspora sp. WMMD406 TaxID=3016095 RepID=UPI00241760B6|nr:hypothetical protein [Solwaraspora sp. WMMD406]MDG4764611.1 hypothetical protein [Solwaraspora sp. WMMD406]